MSDDSEFLRELQKEFLDELQFLIEACEESYLKIENPDLRVEELAKIFRLAHSIKGAGAAVGFTDLAAFAHVMEDCLAVLRAQPALVDAPTISVLLQCGDAIKNRIGELRLPTPPAWDIEKLKFEVVAFTELLLRRAPEGQAPLAEPAASVPVKAETATVKIDSARVEELLDIVGELVVLKSQIVNETAGFPTHSRLNNVIALFDKTIRELQDRTLGMRLTPLKGIFLKIQRAVRDLSLRLNKPIELVLRGEEIEVDRSLVETLSDPLIHLVRNCIDHGIESAETRAAQGKPLKGSITITAQQIGGRAVIRIADDGAGIARDRVIAKAKDLKLVDGDVDPASLTDAQVFEFLFAPGFSTAEKVTDISGRGVGMNVVKENLESLKGRIEVESTPGKGTTFRLSIPVTTAITDGMLVVVDGQVYILPIDGIRELVHASEAKRVPMHNGEKLLNVRGKFFPLLRMGDFLKSNYGPLTPVPKRELERKMVVVFEHETGCVALEVDAVLGQAQVVMKPLRSGVPQADGIAGAAILGDGRVALLVDVGGMVADQVAS